MKKTVLFAVVALLAACSPKQPQDYPIQGVTLSHVHFTDGLLADRERVVRENTIPFAFRKCEETGRIANFARAAGLDTTRFTGLRYDDSDVFKVMEAASYSLATHYDAALDQYMDSLIALVGAAQEPDGYLYTIRTSGGLDVDPKAGPERWNNIGTSHELYNVGHMYEAAVAHYFATGKTAFLDIAKRNADLIYNTFLVPGRPIVSGHEEIELALVKLYRATGDRRYLDLSHFLLECRGDGGEEATHRQNHKRVAEQYEAVGHAVCGTYLFMAMTDNAVLCGDQAYRTAIDSLWNDVTDRKMYLTGGLGSYREKERFGQAYFLPDEETHCETCAAVGSCMWNYRMFCLTGESRYFDIFERTLYNNVLHGISDDGMKFFYANVLQCSPYTFDWEREWARIKPKSRLRRSHRLPWFETCCCPTNLARILLSMPGYVYALGKNSIYVNLFTAGQSAFETLAGDPVELSCETAYPYDGDVRLTLEKAPVKATALRIRIPGWAQGHPVDGTLYTYLNAKPSLPVILVNGETAPYATEKGYAVLDRTWQDGDVVDVRFEMPLRFVKADDRVEAVEGRIAVERGPIIYCAVLPENDKDIRSCTISPEDRFAEQGQDSGSVTLTDTDRQLTFIPYYRHAQKGITQMSIWLKTPYPLNTVAQEKCVLDNGKIRAVFNNGETFTVEEIVMDGQKVAGNGSFAFWDVTLLGPMGETPVYRPKVAKYQGAEQTHRNGVQQLRFTWTLRLDYARPEYPLRAIVSLPDDGDRLYFNLEAELPDGWMVTNVTYPELTLCRPESAKVIIPEGWGLEAPLSAAGHKAVYPTSAMQFVMVHNADGALFFGTEDPSGSRKVYGVDGNVDLHLWMDVPASEAWTSDGTFTLPFAVNLGFDRAGWEHAVNHWYKPYSYTLPWGGEDRKIKNRLSTLSPWLQQTEGWVRLKTVDDEFDALDKAADLLGPHLSAHWYWWHQIEYDTHYPEYLPSRPGFAERVAQIHRKGVHVTPYINGRLWDPHSESYARDGGAEASARKMDGTLYTEIYRTSRVVNSVTCPTSRVWHDKLCGLVDSLQACFGVDGVYIDQVGCTAPAPCWNPSHGHPRGGGGFWLEGYQHILRDIRMDHLRPGAILTTEENGECYSDLFDMMLMVNSLNNDHPGPLKIVPVFPMVYSDRVITSAYTYLPEVLEAGDPSTYRYAFAKAVLYGAQPGWVRAFIITDPKYSAEAAFLRTLMDFRAGIHDIVLGGEFVRDFVPGGKNPLRDYVRFWTDTAVLGAEWRDRDGKPAWILVNTDPVPHQVTLPSGAPKRKAVVDAFGAVVIR